MQKMLKTGLQTLLQMQIRLVLLQGVPGGRLARAQVHLQQIGQGSQGGRRAEKTAARYHRAKQAKEGSD